MNKYLYILKTSITGLNLFERLLLAAILCLTVIGFVMKGVVTFNSMIAAIAAILGVFCVVLGAKGSLANWIFGIIEAFLHIYICFCTHIYGDMLQRLVYNLPMQFIGWNKWKKRVRNDGSQTIHTRYMTWKQRTLTLIAVSAGTVALGLFLIAFGPWFIDTLHSVFPDMEFKTLKQSYDTPMQLWLDSFTTVMSVITMYISVKAFVEQWFMWLTINVAYIALWLMSDSEFSFMTVAKYSVYLINSFYGIYMWNKLSKE
ncbi:MAG: nicotinamide riboside transporter PnuC [Bacteroidales bacterium]|nr:nicotinamide riboside transporter PnuC [Bacteroidales bacterium]MDY5033220.1 nicotinamide riboside transporter PnuC [Prevotella sp.]